MMSKVCGGLTALAGYVLLAGYALADAEVGTFHFGGGGGGFSAPEIDASAGVAALALMASLGALLYSKARK